MLFRRFSFSFATLFVYQEQNESIFQFQLAVSDFVKKIFKMKRYSSDPVPDFEGKGKNANWIAADLGTKFEFFFNVSLYFYYFKTRKITFHQQVLWKYYFIFHSIELSGRTFFNFFWLKNFFLTSIDFIREYRPSLVLARDSGALWPRIALGLGSRVWRAEPEQRGRGGDLLQRRNSRRAKAGRNEHQGSKHRRWHFVI